MLVSWSLMWIGGLICYSDCTCSQTSFYKSCWIRRYPGVYVDVEESQRRGAHILKSYHEDTASKCSRSCCTTRNFSCGLAVFHYNTTEDSVNCFHLNCSNPDSCVLHHRRNVILYHVTKGVDPDLLVFGKHFTSNVRVLPHMSSSRLNLSEPLTSDKRHFNHPPVRSISTTKPTTGALSTTHSIHNHLTRCATRPPSIVLTASLPKTDSTSHSQPHPTQPTNSTTEQLYTTIDENIIYTSTTGPSSTTPSGIILTTAAHSSSPSGALSTPQTDPRSDAVTKTTNSETTPYITELSTTSRQESSQTTSPQAEMTRAPSSSKPSTTLKSLTALQTNTPSQTTTPPTTSQAKETTTTVHTTASSSTSSTSTRRVARDRTSDSTTSSGADSQPYPNDTKGYVSRNISADDGGSLTSVWRLAANTVLVVLGTCASVTLGCCCSVFAALSWRGRRRRKGRYRTNLRGKRGSMKLIKYVIVRESS
ncbi:MANSC domain-containing protein 4-like [Triplophysa rosa]|nr:MANSC domain-containing protein 4-like [Triplophysa rosa]